MPNPTVAEYVIARLADLGIAHVFGLPGDFSFPLDDAIEASDKLSWIVLRRGIVADFLKANVQSGSRLAVVSAYFTLCACEA